VLPYLSRRAAENRQVQSILNCFNIGKLLILRYKKKFFTEYAELTARTSSKSLK
jgi:hypothetical protein